jgi:hypothetical protein
MFVLAVESKRNFLLACAKITVCFRFLSRKQKWGGKQKKEGLEPDCFHQKFVYMDVRCFFLLSRIFLLIGSRHDNQILCSFGEIFHACAFWGRVILKFSQVED